MLQRIVSSSWHVKCQIESIIKHHFLEYNSDAIKINSTSTKDTFIIAFLLLSPYFLCHLFSNFFLKIVIKVCFISLLVFHAFRRK